MPVAGALGMEPLLVRLEPEKQSPAVCEWGHTQGPVTTLCAAPSSPAPL